MSVFYTIAAGVGLTVIIVFTLIGLIVTFAVIADIVTEYKD